MNLLKYILAVLTVVTMVNVRPAVAQHNLQKRVTIDMRHKKISTILSAIEEKGNFYFSYSGDRIQADRTTDLSVHHMSVQSVLDQLFDGHIDYKEAEGYIILRPAPNRLTLVPDSLAGPDNAFFISGRVLDEKTGKGVAEASVFEKQLLVSTLTDPQGFFRIRLKSAEVITLTVSKALYKDTSVNFLNRANVVIKPKNYSYSTDVGAGRAERSWLGRMTLSSRQKIQAINLSGFIADVPVQTSLVPGLGSHGSMSGQTMNHFSLNVLGGYNGGLKGVEVGGLFNINSGDVRYLQVGGLFNMTGGSVQGIAAAGLSNTVLKNSDGLQVAGLYNYTKNEAKGMQVAGLLNRARVMKGVHIAMVNLTDTLDGYAIGLLNLSRNGYHQLVVSGNETVTANIGFKTGNAKLYTVVSAGVNLTDDIRFYSFSAGLGHEFHLKKGYFVAAELSSQTLVSGKWKNDHQLSKLNALMNVPLGPKLSLFAGPSFNVFHDQDSRSEPAEVAQLIRHKPGLMNWGSATKAWLGWNVGFTIF